MFKVFSGATADELWCNAAEGFKNDDICESSNGRTGATREILNACLHLENPRMRWVVSRLPPINIAFALAEVIWIIRGRNDAEFLNYFNRELPKFAGFTDTYHGAYGYRLHHALGINQLERAYKVLKATPESRQVVLQIWNSALDLPSEEGIPVASDIPCNITAMLKVRNGRLWWTQVMRSNDLFLGFVHNVVQFTTLQEVIAGWLSLEVGSYHHYSDSLHVYDRDYEKMATFVKCEAPANTDRLDFDKGVSDKAFKALENLVERIINTEYTASEILLFWDSLSKPAAFNNIGLILICEGWRRRRMDLSEIADILEQCTNLTYCFLYKRWLKRVSI